ncbi:ataxin-2-like protein, partial [Coturnix japonica]|uniref:ataxin-2-like protein n=1 Tax=Coturnix japonica TaxID=93934 RepID=UPI0007777096
MGFLFPYRAQNTGKGPPPPAPMFEGVYNNSRMLHFLTAVVGSRCAVRVRSGSTFEGIFRTLSSKFELALEAVHRGGSGGPRREEIVDTMVFGVSDVVSATFRDVHVGAAPGGEIW